MVVFDWIHSLFIVKEIEMSTDTQVRGQPAVAPGGSSSSVVAARVAATPSKPTAGGQTDQVLIRGAHAPQKKPGDTSLPPDESLKALQRAMRVASADGPEHLERCVGEQIIRSPELLSTAGIFLARKLSDSVGIQSRSIDLILFQRSKFQINAGDKKSF